MRMSWLPDTSQGRMVGDYISTSFAGGSAHPVFEVANVPTAGGSDCATATPNCDQATYSPSAGLVMAASSAARPAVTLPVRSRASDHAAPSSALKRR